MSGMKTRGAPALAAAFLVWALPAAGAPPARPAAQQNFDMICVSLAVELPFGTPLPPAEGKGAKPYAAADAPAGGQGEIADNQGANGVHTMIPAGTPPSDGGVTVEGGGGVHGQAMCPCDKAAKHCLDVEGPKRLREAHRIITLAETLFDGIGSDQSNKGPATEFEIIRMAIPRNAFYAIAQNGAAAPGYTLSIPPQPAQLCTRASGTPAPCVEIDHFDLGWPRSGEADMTPEAIRKAQERAFTTANDVLALKGRLLTDQAYP